MSSSSNRGAEKPLILRPRTSRLVDDFLVDAGLASQIVDACGSPVNILFPQAIADNARAFEEVLAASNVTGAIFFAHKSNQSHSLLKQMALSNLRCDVASSEELRHALGCGFTGNRLEATGPKNADFIALCLLHDVVVNVDSLSELDDIVAVRAALGVKQKARVLLRLCGFLSDQSQVLDKESRFGIRVCDAPGALALLAGKPAEFKFLGFSFHLDSVSLDERLVAIENCLRLFDEALNLGLEPHVLNIGGGFRINYLAEADDWNRYTSAIREAALGSGPQITWQNNFFGLSAQGGTLRGKLNSYGYFEPNPGPGFLQALLNSELAAYGNSKVADVLRDNMIELWLEPGRSLLDQAGLTLARVNALKTSSKGDTLVALNMKRQDIAFLDQEVFVDPILLTRASRLAQPESACNVQAVRNSEGCSRVGQAVCNSEDCLLDGQAVGKPEGCSHDGQAGCSPASGQAGCNPGSGVDQSFYIIGNLCLESDLIFRRKVFMPRLPQRGDLLAFVNTAAYMMDFSATNSIMQPPARRVAAVRENGRFTWMLDECYTPVWQLHR